MFLSSLLLLLLLLSSLLTTSMAQNTCEIATLTEDSFEDICKPLEKNAQYNTSTKGFCESLSSPESPISIELTRNNSGEVCYDIMSEESCKGYMNALLCYSICPPCIRCKDYYVNLLLYCPKTSACYNLTADIDELKLPACVGPKFIGINPDDDKNKYQTASSSAATKLSTTTTSVAMALLWYIVT